MHAFLLYAANLLTAWISSTFTGLDLPTVRSWQVFEKTR